MAKDKVQAANQTRAQKAMAAHEKGSKERASDQATVKAGYLSGNGEVILEDLRAKITAWMALNNKVAQDGVGNRPTGHKLVDGSPEIDTIYLNPAERASYLDQSKGMQAILDYIDRQLTPTNPDAKPKSKQAEADKSVAAKEA